MNSSAHPRGDARPNVSLADAASIDIDRYDWNAAAAQLDAEGHALLPGLLDAAAARTLARAYDTLPPAWPAPQTHAFGRGELRHFDELPAPWAGLRAALYRRLVVVANRWNTRLGRTDRYPAEFDAFAAQSRQAGWFREQSCLCRLGTEDYLALHQRDDGGPVFPLQVVVLLSEPQADFDGGEFVMTEQRPRLQSRPLVLPLALGDAAVITTSVRPSHGSRGAGRVNLRHAISRVRAGRRIGVELSFHLAR